MNRDDNPTIDAAQWHTESGVGDDPEASASWHIVTFVRWAAERGLLSSEHSQALDQLRAAPVDYLWDEMGGKLSPDDLTAEGADFAYAVWQEYNRELGDLCMTHEIENTYHIAVQPNVDEIRGWIEEYLDEELAFFRERVATP